ncbi:MAG TPA: proton-conducting transporter membrane subunit [Desulforhopalus sp.]|nr:proton-conducting transporter membrane subunit [Desulforhopalus sp.]
MLELIFLLPMLVGLLALLLPARVGRGVLVVTATLHLLLSVMIWFGSLPASASAYFHPSAPGLLVLLLTSLVFLIISVYSISYYEREKIEKEPVFNGCMLLFLATMSMVALADHPIVLWIAIEATTLVSAPLIFLRRSKEALEATWKYVLICSVGIALALLGCFFITLSVNMAEIDVPLSFSSLNEVANRLDPLWLKVGFIFVLIGFGTKMGLAPMHTWLPDAHSQAPSPASALLSGALLNCAFLGIYKVHTLMYLAGLGSFSSQLLIGFGLLSMLVAGIFIMKQPDYKRMLAYSSIENMGIIAFGVGIGGFALYGAVLHMVHHSLIKSSLFLSAGNILYCFGTKAVDRVGNLAGVLPRTFVPFFAGFIGISGLPPFGIFISELFILLGAIQGGYYAQAALYVGCLLLVVAGAARIFTDISFAGNGEPPLHRDSLLQVIPPNLLLLASIILCVWMPEILHQTIVNAISILGGTVHG